MSRKGPSGPPNESQAHPARDWLFGTLLVLAVLISYAPVRNAGFVWDDDSFLTENHLIRVSDGLRRFWFSGQAVDYWPLTSSTLWLEWRLWGPHPLGYHVTNVLLHAAETVLLWRILVRLRIPGAFLAAALFAVHPVNVESVAWITQRKNLVAMLFYLLSIRFFIQAEDARPVGRRRAWYGLSLAAFVLAMLGKGSVAMLPVVLLGIVAWRRHLTRGDLLRITPFLVAGAALILVNLRFAQHSAESIARHAGFVERLLGAAAAAWFYLGKAYLPIHLSFVYPLWRISVSDPLWWLPLAAAVALTAVLWLTRRSWGRGPLFAWGYFCVSLVPVMGFTDVYFMRYSLVSDHYEHLALIGAIAPVAAAFALWRGKASRLLRFAADAEALIVVAGLALMTSLQCATYRNLETLWRTNIERSPESWMAYNNLATFLLQNGRTEEAEALCRKALAMDPGHAETRVSLGIALADEGRTEEAITEYRAAIAVQPDLAASYINLGNALFKVGEADEAILNYRKALELSPNEFKVLDDLGMVYVTKGRTAEAIASFRRSLAIRDDFAQAHFNLANVLHAIGSNAEAKGEYERTIELDPRSATAHANLGNMLLADGRIDEAIAHYRRALEISPETPNLRRNLDIALGRQEVRSRQVAH
jgi:tetratricopeptide (TPR) repeat protein